jgi:hypothetical protein
MKTLEIIAVLVAAILTILATFKWKTLDWIGRSALIVGIVAAAIVAYNSYEKNQRDDLLEQINATYGDISDLDGATIPEVQIGEDGTKFVLLDGVFNFKPFGPLIKVYVKDKKLFVNTIIHQKGGEVIAAIDGNTWTTFDKNYEYNNDETAFELVTAGERKVYFQIALKNGIAHMSGILLNEKGEGIEFVNRPDLNGSTLTPIGPYATTAILQYYIQPIFKYPRQKYYGQRVN